MDLKTTNQDKFDEKIGSKKIINHNLNNDDDEEEDEDSSSDLPPLESIEKEMNSLKSNNNKNSNTNTNANSNKKKNIIIPEDGDGESNRNKNKKKEIKKDGDNLSDSSDDPDQENDDDDDGGYMDLLNNGELKKKIIKPGNSNVRPPRGSKVIIRLETRIYLPGEDDKDVGSGKLIPEETFERFTLTLGDNDLHQGLDLIIPLMELNEICRAIIKPRFGYGQLGNKNIGIPEEATLDCQIELLEIPQPSDNIYGEEDENADSICNKESLDERLNLGNYKKLRGNFWFQRDEYSLAIQCYRGALKYLDANHEELKAIDQNKQQNNSNEQQQQQSKQQEQDDEYLKKIEDLLDKRAQTFNNLAAAQMKINAFSSALRSVKDSLLIRPNNVKALFRKAKILAENGDYEEAINDLKKATTIDPKSEAVILELDRLKKILAKQLNEQKNMYKRMMQVNDQNNQNTTTDSKQQKQEKNGPSNNKKNNQQNSKTKNLGGAGGSSSWSTISLVGFAAIAAIACGGAFLMQTFYSIK